MSFHTDMGASRNAGAEGEAERSDERRRQRYEPDCPCANKIGPFPAEPPPGSPEAVAQAARTLAGFAAEGTLHRWAEDGTVYQIYPSGLPGGGLWGPEGQPVLRECVRLAAREVELQADNQRLRAEVERLTAWLRKIDGGDNPCLDEAVLRQWAYDAVTLGREAPRG